MAVVSELLSREKREREQTRRWLETIDEYRQLQDPSYLPSHQEIIDFFTDPKTGSLDLALWLRFLRETQFHDLLTAEYIEGLASYLNTRALELGASREKLLITLEIGAGNGRLGHFLIPELNTNLIEHIQTSRKEGIKSSFPSEPREDLDYQQTLEKYNPNIVICSWMPWWEDWTEDFRDMASVKEYLLIGDEMTCGCPWETWGHQGNLHQGGTPPFKKDGFVRFDLENLDKYHLGIRWKGGENGPIQSKTASFRRLNI